MDDNWAFHVPLKAVTLCQVWMSAQGNAQAMGSKAKRKNHIAPSQRTKKTADLIFLILPILSRKVWFLLNWYCEIAEHISQHVVIVCYSSVTCIHAFHRLRLEPKRIPLLTVMSLLLQYCHLVLLHPILKKKSLSHFVSYIPLYLIIVSSSRSIPSVSPPGFGWHSILKSTGESWFFQFSNLNLEKVEKLRGCRLWCFFLGGVYSVYSSHITTSPSIFCRLPELGDIEISIRAATGVQNGEVTDQSPGVLVISMLCGK